MRIKFRKSSTEQPQLAEVSRVYTIVKDGEFSIEFEAGSMTVVAQISVPDDECLTEAKCIYECVLTELALDGYTNLCQDGQRCRLDKRWSIFTDE